MTRARASEMSRSCFVFSCVSLVIDSSLVVDRSRKKKGFPRVGKMRHPPARGRGLIEATSEESWGAEPRPPPRPPMGNGRRRSSPPPRPPLVETAKMAASTRRVSRAATFRPWALVFFCFRFISLAAETDAAAGGWASRGAYQCGGQSN